MSIMTCTAFAARRGQPVVDGETRSNKTFTAVPAGTLLPIGPRKIKAATTATLILAIW